MTFAEFLELWVLISKIAWIVLAVVVVAVIYTLKKMLESYNEWYKEYGRDL